MPKILSAAIAIVLFAIGILPAAAQNARSFVSAHGSDSAACTLAAPCRTLAVAFAATNASGEIDVLDTAGYGPLTITKAISIINDGSIASVLVPSGGNGITINAGPNDAVSLRGLSIEGAGVGSNGILFNTGKSLTVQNSIIRHMTNDGINFAPSASSNLSVSNSLVADNSVDGIHVAPSGSGTVKMVLNRVEANNNGSGILVIQNSGTILATVSDSVVAGNGTGIVTTNVNPIIMAASTVTVVRSVSANNSVGFEVDGVGVTVHLANSTVTGNTQFGWVLNNSGFLGSYGDNYINGNGPNVGSLTVVGKQ